MKHVHAEVIKAWADDTSVQIELDTGSGWRPATAQPNFWEHCNLRIKPQPKAISWTNIYPNGRGGDPHVSREQAETFSLEQAAYIVEIRDDGTAHLHKVEA